MNDSLELHEAELIRRNGTYYVLNDGHEYICTFPMDVNNISEGKLAEFVIHRNRAVGLRVKPKPEPIRYGTLVVHHDGPRVKYEQSTIPLRIYSSDRQKGIDYIGSTVRFKILYKNTTDECAELMEIVDKAFIVPKSALEKLSGHFLGSAQEWNEIMVPIIEGRK